MKIKEKMVGDVAVLYLSGNMMGGPDTAAVHDKVKSLIADGIKKIVIDLKGVKWMNSSGLGVLMSCLGTATKNEAELKLASVTDKVQSILMVTKLIEIFDTYENADRAVASFK